MSRSWPFRVRFGWGLNALRSLGSGADAAVIVDVLSFSTCVDVALARGATIFACRWYDERATELAKAQDAVLAGPRGSGISLSPLSLMGLKQDDRVVLPSPNGSTLSLESPSFHTLTASFRNAAAVAKWLQAQDLRSIAVIAAGEKWHDDTMHPGIEDLAGAGAVIEGLGEDISPDARVARAAFREIKDSLPEALHHCTTAQDLVERGFHEDIKCAAELNVSDTVPIFAGDAYQNAE